MRPIEPARRIRRWNTYLAAWTVHRILGLAAAALLVLLSTTGVLLVLHHDLERWWGSGYRTAAPPPGGGATSTVSLTDGVRAAARLAPAGYRALRIEPAQAADETHKLIFVAPDGWTRWSAFLDPHRGIVWHGPDQALFTPWLLHLHMHLHLGPWGYAVTGLAGAALLALGLTGLYLHRYDLAAWCRHPFPRRGRGPRRWLHDLHGWIGTLSIYFSIVLGATGLAFAILILPGRLAPRPKPAAPFDLERLAAIEPAIAAARSRLPGQELFRAALPATNGAVLRLTFLDRGAPVWAKFSSVDFDPERGGLLRVRPGRDATAGEKWRAVVAPLHFGLFGSGWVKALYVAGGLCPGLLAVTGVGLELRRRRKRSAQAAGRTALPRAGPLS